MQKKHLITALSLLALGASGHQAKAAVDPFEKCEVLTGSDKAACACEIALDDGSASAIQALIDKYAKDLGETACAALASTSTRQEDPNDDRDGDDCGRYC